MMRRDSVCMLDRPHSADAVADQALSALGEALRAAQPALSDWAEQGDASGVVAPASWECLRRIGLLTAPLALDAGGLDLVGPDATATLLDVLRRLGAADLSLARLFEGHVNAVALVRRYGNPAQVEAFARAIRDGAVSGVWAADDAEALRAEPDGDGLRLRGRKILASGSGFLARPLVTAATPDGPMLLLLDPVPHERCDLSRWTAQGMRASATGTVNLEGMTIRPEQMIGRPGDFLRQPQLSGGAWRFCAVHLGAAERLVDLFRDQLVARGRAGDPYQLQRVAHGVAAVGTAALWIGHAAQRLAEASAEDADATVALANLTRMVTERAALDVLEAVHRGGGLGSFLRPNPIERIGRDLAIYLRQPMPDLAMADAARMVLASKRETADLWRTA